MEQSLRASHWERFASKRAPYFFILPWIIGFLSFTLGPLIFSLIMSFFDWSITGTPSFVGFGNYLRMFTQDPQFWDSLRLTFKFVILFVPLNIILALILAVLLTRNVKGILIYRIIFYMPAVISGVAVGIIWGWILNSRYGILNYLLELIGIEGPAWLVDPQWAIVALVIASAWGVGSMMLIFYTDIRSIPIDYYEAAEIDGASKFYQFFKITLPIITPTIFFNLVTSVITALQQLTLVMILTKGGPMKSTYLYGLYVYDNAFRHQRLGYASANAWVMFIIILILTGLIFRSSDAWVFYENEVKKPKKKTKKEMDLNAKNE